MDDVLEEGEFMYLKFSHPLAVISKAIIWDDKSIEIRENNMVLYPNLG